MVFPLPRGASSHERLEQGLVGLDPSVQQNRRMEGSPDLFYSFGGKGVCMQKVRGNVVCEWVSAGMVCGRICYFFCFDDSWVDCLPDSFPVIFFTAFPMAEPILGISFSTFCAALLRSRPRSSAVVPLPCSVF